MASRAQVGCSKVGGIPTRLRLAMPVITEQPLGKWRPCAAPARVAPPSAVRGGARTLAASQVASVEDDVEQSFRSKSAEVPADKYGFEMVREEFVKEYGSLCTLFKHKKTGAEVMSVQSKDENKTFGCVFRTPVVNSTGIPHILEHSVLCGSRKYPIKEPFVELMKSSLNTFLNAFTYPDRTCYPVASCNLKDFYNLVDVYLDAVFYPRCIQQQGFEEGDYSGEQVFQQEGWHYELESEDTSTLTYKGVVFNEMKGVYSSPDSVLGRVCQQQVFPDNTYGVDSGGDPGEIPSLSYQDFKAFHADYYHPSNTRFWFYGDDDVEKRLQILSAYLDDFAANEQAVASSKVLTQKFFAEPRTVTDHYSVSETEGESKAYACVNWLLAEDTFDVETQLAVSFLDFLLLGTSGSPLRKALIDSGLGEAVCGGGLEDELRQPTFSIGLKGVKEQDLPEVEALVLKTLEELRTEGFTQSAIEAAMNTIEFAMRENNTGSFPRGLSLMLRSMANWIYDKDPFEPMKWETQLAAFKAKLAADGKGGNELFGSLIGKYLLDNNHRVTVHLLPDPKLAQRQESEEQGRLEQMRASMTESDVKELIESTKLLKQHQETPDSSEKLKCVPSLSLEDIPPKSATIPTRAEAVQGAEVLKHDLFTNDVVYAEVALDMSAVPAELLYLMPLFCRSLTDMGTQKETFVELTERIGRKTGGLSAYPYTSPVRGSSAPAAYVVVRGKATSDKFGEYLDIVREVLHETDFSDQARFKQMVLETKARQEASIVGSGHSYAMGRLSAQRGTAGWLGEQLGGVENITKVRSLLARVDSDWESVRRDLEQIRQCILSQQGTIVNLTADEATLAATDDAVSGFVSSLPSQAQPRQQWADPAAPSLTLPGANELLLVPTQVNYVGQATNLYEDAGYDLHGSSMVISKYLGSTWLWDRVRVSGGAYGGFCNFDVHSGGFSFLSYRDPNLLPTVANYEGSAGFLQGLEMAQDDLNKAIIACIGDVDSYQLPDAKGYTAFARHVLKITDEQRQERREQILATSQADFRAFGDVLQASLAKRNNVVAVTNKDQAEQATQARPELGFVAREVL